MQTYGAGVGDALEDPGDNVLVGTETRGVAQRTATTKVKGSKDDMFVCQRDVQSAFDGHRESLRISKTLGKTRCGTDGGLGLTSDQGGLQ
jgi:hypothetical protein